MYAIIATGGKQYKVAKGDVIDVEKLDVQPGDKLSLDVLALVDGEKVLATPAELEGAQVEAEVIDQHKGKKVLVFKLKKRKRYHRTNGHRQNLTRLVIVGISAAGVDVEDAASPTEPEEVIEDQAPEAEVAVEVVEKTGAADEAPADAKQDDGAADADADVQDAPSELGVEDAQVETVAEDADAGDSKSKSADEPADDADADNAEDKKADEADEDASAETE